ncbi:hypothetical protein Q7C_2229 [Methylophaga frappieri]|uniref:Lipoprotein n=1 Tax=Methylophaga frappieri (strain ATCC BAA-2434 / DSM 25690 / JAM7) TaxID=754477 RepID=I1YKC2_METFJ|nr:lipoprotein [Methylophaga frappieri]AFJ03365.1 hypothetical protein Q7C_2229 [Methylophaga frappieri]
MQTSSGWRTLALILCTVSLLTACGQKGDLYLPEGKAQTIEVA